VSLQRGKSQRFSWHGAQRVGHRRHVATLRELRGRTAGSDGASRARYNSSTWEGHRSNGGPAGRRNRPPEHRRKAGRRRPYDDGSRFHIGPNVCNVCKVTLAYMLLHSIDTRPPAKQTVAPLLPLLQPSSWQQLMIAYRSVELLKMRSSSIQ